MQIIHQVFKEGNLTGALVSVFKLLLQAFNIPIELVTGIFTKGVTAIDLIVKDPLGFLSNVLGAVKLGFRQFFDKILDPSAQWCRRLVVWWIGRKRNPKANRPYFMSILKFVFEILDIRLETIFGKLEKKIGPEKVKMLRTATKVLGEAWEWISIAIKEGPAGLWRKLLDQLSNLWTIFIKRHNRLDK